MHTNEVLQSNCNILDQGLKSVEETELLLTQNVLQERFTKYLINRGFTENSTLKVDKL